MLFTVADDVIAVLDRHRVGRWPRRHGRCRTSCPLHLACYRDDPAIGAVVHAHPPAVVAADLAGIPLVPLVGAYNIPAARLAADGIATFPRAVLINTDELAAAMRTRDGRPPGVRAARPRHHGGRRHPRAGRRPRPGRRRPRPDGRPGRRARRASRRARPDDELAQLPDLGASFNDELVWRFHERRLEPRRAGDRDDDRRRRHRRRHRARDDPGPRLQRSRRVRARARAAVRLGLGVPGPRVRGAVPGRLRRAADPRRLVHRRARRGRVGAGAVQHVPAPRDAGVPGRGRQRVALPLPVPRVVVSQRRARWPGCRSTRTPTAATTASRGRPVAAAGAARRHRSTG